MPTKLPAVVALTLWWSRLPPAATFASNTQEDTYTLVGSTCDEDLTCGSTIYIKASVTLSGECAHSSQLVQARQQQA
jgi:hypothetical protein